MNNPILGQEVRCPEGIGRIVDIIFWGDEVSDITVKLHVLDYTSSWDPSKVEVWPPSHPAEILYCLEELVRKCNVFPDADYIIRAKEVIAKAKGM
jgi:hypothetical protein